MSALSIALLSILYLAVGILAARIRAERTFNPQDLGTHVDGFGTRVERTPRAAEDFWLGTGVAVIFFWPLVAIGLAAIGLGLGVTALLKRALVPTQLRRMLGDRPS